MKNLTLLSLLAFATLPAFAADLGLRIVIQSPRENRAIVELSTETTLTYRECNNIALSIPGNFLPMTCSRLGVEVPNTDLARAALDRAFAGEMSEVIAAQEKGVGRPWRMMRAALDGLLGTFVTQALLHNLPGVRTPRGVALNLIGWTTLSALLRGSLNASGVANAPRLRPFADGAGSLARSRQWEAARGLERSHGMNLIAGALARATSSVAARRP